MQDIKMVVTGKCIKLGQERAKRLWMRMFVDVTVHLNCINRHERQHARQITHAHSAQSGPRRCSLCPLSTSEA